MTIPEGQNWPRVKTELTHQATVSRCSIEFPPRGPIPVKDLKNFIQENLFSCIGLHSKLSGLIGLMPMHSGHTTQQQCYHRPETPPQRRFYVETTSPRRNNDTTAMPRARWDS